MNTTTVIFGILAILLAFFAIFAGFVSMNSVYQMEWRDRFANQHLDLAQASSDAKTQAKEIATAKTLFGYVPTTGNFDYFNKLNPKTNLETFWSTINEMQVYANNSAQLAITDSAYQIAVYNTQEKIQYFQNNFNDATSSYRTWGAGGFVGGVGIILALLSMLFAFISTTSAIVDDEPMVGIAFMLSSMIPILIVAIFFLWVSVSPVFYGGI